MVQSTVLVVAVGFVLVNLAVDLLYRVIDPRTRRCDMTTTPPVVTRRAVRGRGRPAACLLRDGWRDRNGRIGAG